MLLHRGKSEVGQGATPVVSKKCASYKPTNIRYLGGGVIGEAGFREAVRLERGVRWVVVDSVAPIVERVE